MNPLSCPFCSSKDLNTGRWFDFSVFCNECGARGPGATVHVQTIENIRLAAIAMWNNRTQRGVVYYPCKHGVTRHCGICEADGMDAQKQPDSAQLMDIIERASVQFLRDGSDGEISAKMLAILNEATSETDEKPRRRWHVKMDVEADSFEDLIEAMQRITHDVSRAPNDNGGLLCSPSYCTHHVVSENKNMTATLFRKILRAYNNRPKK